MVTELNHMVYLSANLTTLVWIPFCHCCERFAVGVCLVPNPVCLNTKSNPFVFPVSKTLSTRGSYLSSELLA